MTFACERFRSYIFGWQVSWPGLRNFAERLLDPGHKGPSKFSAPTIRLVRACIACC